MAAHRLLCCEAWLRRLGGLWIRQLIPEVAQSMLVRRLADGLLRGAGGLEVATVT